MLVDQNQQSYATQVSRAMQLQRSTPGKLDPTIELSVTLDDYTRLEFLYLRRTVAFQAAVTMVGGAGRSLAQLTTSLASPSGTIATLRRFMITNDAAVGLVYNFGLAQATAGASAGVTSTLDARALNETPSLVASSINTVGAPVTPNQGIVRVPAQSTVVVDVNFVLVSGGPLSFKVIDTVAANPLSCTFVWEERARLVTE